MHRAPDGIQRALEDYPRGFRRLEMWAENAIQLYKETQLAFLPGSPVRGPGEWRCSGTCDELAQGCSVAAAPGPARRPGGGPGLLTSSSSQETMGDVSGTFLPTLPSGCFGSSHETPQHPLAASDLSQVPRGLAPACSLSLLSRGHFSAHDGEQSLGGGGEQFPGGLGRLLCSLGLCVLICKTDRFSIGFPYFFLHLLFFF